MLKVHQHLERVGERGSAVGSMQNQPPPASPSVDAWSGLCFSLSVWSATEESQ